MEDLIVLYEDNQVIVVVKPQNVPSQADITGDLDMLTIVKNYIGKKYNKTGNVFIGLVHRLDRPTGGLWCLLARVNPLPDSVNRLKKANWRKNI